MIEVDPVAQEIVHLQERRRRLKKMVAASKDLRPLWEQLESRWQRMEEPLSRIRQGGPPEIVQPALLEVDREVAEIRAGYESLEGAAEVDPRSATPPQ